jgi:hypothetical protein
MFSDQDKPPGPQIHLNPHNNRRPERHSPEVGASQGAYFAIIKGFALAGKLQSNGLHPIDGDAAISFERIQSEPFYLARQECRGSLPRPPPQRKDTGAAARHGLSYQAAPPA